MTENTNSLISNDVKFVLDIYENMFKSDRLHQDKIKRLKIALKVA